jgi:hypothetical protein
MIAMDCSRCGRHHEVADALAGQTLYCADCNSAMRIPAPGEAAPPPATASAQEPRLRLAGQGHSADGGRLCAACGLAMDSEAVVCVGCGFDTRTGLRPADVARQRRARRSAIGFVLLLLVLGAGVWGAFHLYGPASSAPSDGSEPVVADPFPEDEPASFEPLPPEAVAAVRKELAAVLDREAPLLIPGQNCALTRNTGQVLRGTLQRITPGVGAHLILETGEIALVPTEDLNPLSRVQVDPMARAAELERRVQVQIAL